MNDVVFTLLTLLGLAGALAFFLGLALITAPGATLRGLAWFGRHDPVARLARWSDERRYVERHVYRHHRLFGAAIAAGAIFASLQLLNQAVPKSVPAQLSQLILLGAVRFLWMANTAFIVVGLIIFFRPSVLKALETWANRWVAIQSPARIDEFFLAAPRTAGMILATIGIYLLSLMIIG